MTLFRVWNAARAIRGRCFFQQPKIKGRRGRDPDLRGFNRSADGYVKVSRVLAAGGRAKSAMAGARPTQDRMSCGGKSGPRPSGHGVPTEPAGSAWLHHTPNTKPIRKSVVEGKSVSVRVELAGRHKINKKKQSSNTC